MTYVHVCHQMLTDFFLKDIPLVRNCDFNELFINVNFKLHISFINPPVFFSLAFEWDLVS